MGIYIKGMNMPKNCMECVFYRNTSPAYDYCCISTAIPKGYIPEDCPLVDVKTPHGRLVDFGDIKYKGYTEAEINSLFPTVIEGED